MADLEQLRHAWDLGAQDAREDQAEGRDNDNFCMGRTWDDGDMNEAYDGGVNSVLDPSAASPRP